MEQQMGFSFETADLRTQTLFASFSSALLIVRLARNTLFVFTVFSGHVVVSERLKSQLSQSPIQIGNNFTLRGMPLK